MTVRHIACIPETSLEVEWALRYYDVPLAGVCKLNNAVWMKLEEAPEVLFAEDNSISVMIGWFVRSKLDPKSIHIYYITTNEEIRLNIAHTIYKYMVGVRNFKTGEFTQPTTFNTLNKILSWIYYKTPAIFIPDHFLKGL